MNLKARKNRKPASYLPLVKIVKVNSNMDKRKKGRGVFLKLRWRAKMNFERFETVVGEKKLQQKRKDLVARKKKKRLTKSSQSFQQKPSLLGPACFS